MIGLPILVPFVLAIAGWLIGRKKETLYYYIALATTAVIFLCAVGLVFQPNQTLEIGNGLICDQGLKLELDGFRKVYGVIISFMWMMTMALSKDYFHHHHNLARYFFFNLMTLGATFGVFLAKDLYTAFIFFEIMSFTSFPWVIQEETDGAIRAANTYLAVAVIGGLTALMGIFLIYHELGTTEISQLYELAQNCAHKGTLYAAGGCILFGFGAKAGMFPLHIWLPKAHPVAPAPASSLLSGVLTKSGVWGILAISCNLFRYDPKWGFVILILGTITMFLGALLALFSIDLKRTLACSSMSQIGFVLVGIGMMGLLGHEGALAGRGALLHMVNHSLFKLVLFMCAGVVYMNVHKLDLNEVKGFGRHKLFLNICFLLGAAGISGIPGLNGYISKTLIHESIVEGVGEYGSILKVIEWIFLISGGFTLAYMTKLYVCLFVDKQDKFEEKKSYMSPLSYFALGGSAVVLPILGFTCNLSMNAIADLGTDFFHSGALEHAIHYYSLENLKGGLISIAIGALVYLLIVRKFMIKDGKYVDLWPAGLDLEDRVYRPLLLHILPTVFGTLSSVFAENMVTGAIYRYGVRFAGILSRVFCDLVDAVVLGLRRTVYAESAPFESESLTSTFPYRLGAMVDRMKGNKGKKKHYYAHRYYQAYNTFVNSTHNLSDSLSFALLCLVTTITVILAYVLIIHAL